MHAAALWTRMTDSWGYFTGEGYAGHLFPVIIGETGTMYQTVSPQMPALRGKQHPFQSHALLPLYSAISARLSPPGLHLCWSKSTCTILTGEAAWYPTTLCAQGRSGYIHSSRQAAGHACGTIAALEYKMCRPKILRSWRTWARTCATRAQRLTAGTIACRTCAGGHGTPTPGTLAAS